MDFHFEIVWEMLKDAVGSQEEIIQESVSDFKPDRRSFPGFHNRLQPRHFPFV